MWTPETRGRVARIRKKLKRYPTDMTDEEWSMIAPVLPQPSARGRPRKTDLREVVNAIRYLVRTGCGWEMLPSDFPPWQTGYVERTVCRRDRRAKEVRPTPLGVRAFEEVLPIVTELQEDILSGLDQSEKASFMMLANKVIIKNAGLIRPGDFE